MSREDPCRALARDAAAVVALLERFGGLLTDALDAVGRRADEDFAVAVAERGRVTVALSNRLAALAVARAVARRNGAAASEVARLLEPVDRALRHAHALHDRVEDARDGHAPAAGGSDAGTHAGVTVRGRTRLGLVT